MFIVVCTDGGIISEVTCVEGPYDDARAEALRLARRLAKDRQSVKDDVRVFEPRHSDPDDGGLQTQTDEIYYANRLG